WEDLHMEHVKTTDYEVYQAIEKEKGRQQDKIELIASENFVSESVMEAMGSVLTNKYAEGYPGKRYYGAVNLSILLKIWRVIGLNSFLGQNMLMCSHTQALKRIWQFILRRWSRVIPFLV